jgi:HSP20 family molecular chaperone IbpA
MHRLNTLKRRSEELLDPINLAPEHVEVTPSKKSLQPHRFPIATPSYELMNVGLMNNMWHEAEIEAEAQRSPHPPTDIVVSEDSCTYFIDLPGFENLEVFIKGGGRMFVTGERKAVNDSNGAVPRSCERSAGQFSRQFLLPKNVFVDGAVATYSNGVLTIMFPLLPTSTDCVTSKVTIPVNYYPELAMMSPPMVSPTKTMG